MSLNVDKWKLFKYSDIFIIRKGFYNKKPEHNSIGKIPFLGATSENNGITEYYSLEDIEVSSKTGDSNNANIEQKIFPGNALCVTNNGSVGYAFYQKGEFTCSHDVNPLYLKNGEFNMYTALFVATVISKDRYRWDYGRKWRPERMENSKILLPIIKEDKLDLKYMEEYIKSLRSKQITTTITKSNNIKLNDTRWDYFIFGDLLSEINKAKSYSKVELTTIDYPNKDYIPFVSRTEKNNGVDCYCLKEDVEKTEKGNAIVIGDTTSTISYQEKEFATGDHLVIIRADWLNKYTGLFIVSILQKERFRYSYGRAFLMDSIKKTKLKLPISKKNKPDWTFMEEYIKSLPYADKI